MKFSKNFWKGVATVCFGTAIWFFPMPEGLQPQAWQLFALTVAIIMGFILNPLPIVNLAIWIGVGSFWWKMLGLW